MDSIDPIAEGDDEAEAGEEVAGELVVAGGDTAEVLQAAEGALDDVAGLVGERVEGMPVHPGDLVGNDGGGAARSQEASQVVDVVGLVADQAAARRRRGNERGRALDVGDLAAGQEDGVRPPLAVDERVDLGRAPTSRAPDGLGVLPPGPPEAQRCAFTAEESIST